ncbi:hypothetical protein [Dongshaea marina]|uniref:hypothetical protein n=1 Tax=Dongshaea marina TaxID=2047966 RepID=UPI000D3EC756|nr:hypothetical protein [Dongshaea marina]
MTYQYRLFVQPGEYSGQTFARYPNSRFVALVAGYQGNSGQKIIISEPFPVEHTTSGILFWTKSQYQPGKLSMRLRLGAQSLQKSSQ